jgi:hypothetical protein
MVIPFIAHYDNYQVYERDGQADKQKKLIQQCTVKKIMGQKRRVATLFILLVAEPRALPS